MMVSRTYLAHHELESVIVIIIIIIILIIIIIIIIVIVVIIVIIIVIVVVVQGFPDYFALVGLGKQQGGVGYNRNATLDDR